MRNLFHHLSKRLSDNSITFAAEAAVITVELDYYQHMDPEQYGEVVYSEATEHISISAGHQTIVVLREMKGSTS